MDKGGAEVLAAEEGDDVAEGGGPGLPAGFGVGADGFDVEGEGEALLGAGEVEEGGADDGFEHGVGVVEGADATGEAVEEELVLVEGGEDGAVAPEEVDVAGEAVRGGDGVEEELKSEVGEFVWVGAGGEGPGIAFGGEDGGSGGVEGAEGVEEGRVGFGFGDLVEVVGVLAEVDEVGGVGSEVWGVRPGDD